MTASPPANSDRWPGTVVAIQANFSSVQLDPLNAPIPPDSDSLRLLCVRRGLLKKLGQQVMVGDRVEVEQPDWQDRRGAIATILPRKTVLDRPPVANVDQILLVFALAEPTLDPNQLTRFLVKAESTEIPIHLCLNKRDLISTEQAEHWRQRLVGWGYQPTLVSLRQAPQLIDTLTAQLQGRISVVAGPSGVGKSSLINRLIPAQTLRVGAVSGKLGRGRHTTRHVELFELPQGGFLADTPGFNQPDIQCSPEALGHCFPEIRQRLADQSCQFSNCLHRDEPGCAVRGDWERYDYYLALLDEVLTQQQQLDEQRNAEATEKVKVSADGKLLHEPRLAAKKYRRPSRKARNQAFQEIFYDLSDAEDLSQLEDLEDLGLE